MSTPTLGAVTHYVRRLSEHDTCGLTDRQLLDRFTVRRDEAAFAELVRRHGPMVLSVCRRVLRQEQDAEDAFQASFLVLARKADSVRTAESVGGWLYQVTHRIALRARAVAGRWRRQSTSLSDAVPAPDPPRNALGASLDRELGRLPEQYRSAVVLCYLEGRTQAEAARLLETTAHAVNSRLKRARELLRQRLTRCGFLLSGVAVTEALTAGAACAALPPALARLTARTALQFAAQRASACGASALAAALARGALRDMMTPKLKILSALALLAALLTAGPLLVPPPALGDDPPAAAPREPARPAQPAAKGKPAPPVARAKARPACIILWMQGGPSQIDTFDPKPKHPNGALFKPIDTSVKGVQISEALPKMAKLANHLSIIRAVRHREGDHARGTYLMHTGRPPDGVTTYPELGCVLGKELGKDRPDLPPFVRIAPQPFFGVGPGPGYLGSMYAPLPVGEVKGFGEAPGRLDEVLRLPPIEEFQALGKARGERMRKAVEKAFDLTQEKAQVRAAYGLTVFGQGCLLARRLVEAGVPVVEVTLPGWDTHADARAQTEQVCANLDAAWSALLKDLHERGRLDSTLVVWMGEFGRTPRINRQQGRDHWPMSFSVVLAGRGIKGGRVIGKTSADGIQIEDTPVIVPELHATIYRALGVDLTREYQSNLGAQIPVVDKGTQPVREALR